MKNAATRLTNQTVSSKHDGVTSETWTNNDILELRLGMIVSALSDIRDDRKSKKMQEEAKAWFMSNDSHSPFSALNCCLAVGLDIHRLRQMMNTLTRGGLFNDL